MELKIQNLKVEVEGKEIPKGVDLNVASGEIHAIMGPNGSGKSTLAYTLAGHPGYKVTEGKVILNTQYSIFNDKRQMTNDKLQSINILKLTPSERARVGIFLAFQNPVSVEGVSVQTFLWQAKQSLDKSEIRNSKLQTNSNTENSKREIEVVKSIVGFRDFKKKLVEYCQVLGLEESFLSRGLNEGFSGGERKKLEVLQMMALRPKVIILDETDSGTDVDAMKKVAGAVTKYLKEEKDAMIIMITHYNRILKYLRPNKVHIFLNGKIVRSGDGRLADTVEKKGFGEFKMD